VRATRMHMGMFTFAYLHVHVHSPLRSIYVHTGTHKNIYIYIYIYTYIYTYICIHIYTPEATVGTPPRNHRAVTRLSSALEEYHRFLSPNTRRYVKPEYLRCIRTHGCDFYTRKRHLEACRCKSTCIEVSSDHFSPFACFPSPLISYSRAKQLTEVYICLQV
jgi:hypothetical protein